MLQFRYASALIALVGIALSFPAESAGSHSRRGYVTKQGTYVPPSRATNPNRTQRDNYSSKPNINPYTGKQGTKEPAK